MWYYGNGSVRFKYKNCMEVLQNTSKIHLIESYTQKYSKSLLWRLMIVLQDFMKTMQSWGVHKFIWQWWELRI